MRIEGVQPLKAREIVPLGPGHLESKLPQPVADGLELLEAVEEQGGVRLASRAKGSSTPTCSSAVTSPASPKARNQTPPRPASSVGFATSVIPSPSP